VEDGHGERGGFTGAGLGRAQNVLAFENKRNGLGLDRRGGFVGNSAQNWIGEP